MFSTSSNLKLDTAMMAHSLPLATLARAGEEEACIRDLAASEPCSLAAAQGTAARSLALVAGDLAASEPCSLASTWGAPARPPQPPRTSPHPSCAPSHRRGPPPLARMSRPPGKKVVRVGGLSWT